jgi:hypothetical protein
VPRHTIRVARSARTVQHNAKKRVVVAYLISASPAWAARLSRRRGGRNGRPGPRCQPQPRGGQAYRRGCGSPSLLPCPPAPSRARFCRHYPPRRNGAVLFSFALPVLGKRAPRNPTEPARGPRRPPPYREESCTVAERGAQKRRARDATDARRV